MRETASCGIFQHKSASRDRCQFWQEIAINCNYQDFSLILHTFRDWFMTVMRKYNDKTQKETQRTEFAGEEKTEYKIIYDNTCILLIQKKLQQWGKRHLKI